MPDLESLKAELSQLPLGEREEIVALLERSIAADHKSLADRSEAENLAVCQERLDRHDRGGAEATPFGRALHRAFADR